ncbi:MAG: XRE family transcriptional regulator [Treponema sp.]|jgi:transcriptional regulator with XRE-family HTH domain|nr:XRE family transcriptional regulator [Treponema sp.]
MLRENLRAAINSSGMIVKEIAEKSGVKKRTIDKWVGAEATEPKVNDLYRVCQTIGITIEWAVSGNEKGGFYQEIIAIAHKIAALDPKERQDILDFIDIKLKKAEKSRKPTETLSVMEPAPPYITATPETEGFDNVESVDYDMAGVLYLGDYAATAAGELREMLDDPGEYQIRYVSRKLLKADPENCFCLPVRGTSMTEAGISDGDEVVLALAESPENGAVMLVSYDGKSTLKRVVIRGNKVILRWEDGSGKEEEIKKEGYQVLGKLLLILKS